MEFLEVREALTTAIMLGEVARSSHMVEIDGIGEVQINNGNVAIMAASGEWQNITRENLEKRLQQLTLIDPQKI